MSASLHRKKLYGLFERDQKGVLYLKGAELMYLHGTDYEFPFRQEPNFRYLTGVNEPDYHTILDLDSREFHLFAPKRDTHFAVWHGRIKPMEEIRRDYQPDHLHLDSALPSVLNEMNPEVVYCLNEEQAEYLEDLDRNINVDTESLQDAITYCRCIKSPWELDQLRGAARVNNIAHRKVMEAIEPTIYEYEIKALFDYHQIRHGLLLDAYNGIHASGPNSAILHYTDNNRKMADGDLFLIDAGYQMNGYASDVTRSFPVNGVFTDEQAAIYQVVLDAQKAAIRTAGPGVKMEDLHILASRIILKGLAEFGLVRGGMDDLMENDIFALFFPHGVGHFLGLDTHDVGGYPKGVRRVDRPGLRYLRVRRELLSGMVITVEPGIYFIPSLLKPALEDKEKAAFLNREKIEGLMDFGGIRIEDNLIITEEGSQNLTDVPKEIKEIEKTMKLKTHT